MHLTTRKRYILIHQRKTKLLFYDFPLYTMMKVLTKTLTNQIYFTQIAKLAEELILLISCVIPILCKTKRWTLRIFFNMLDGSGINAVGLFSLANPQFKINKNDSCCSFLKFLGKSLIEPHLIKVSTLQRRLCLQIIEIKTQIS